MLYLTFKKRTSYNNLKNLKLIYCHNIARNPPEHIAMTSIIKLLAISGGSESESPPCYLLQVDEVRILLDCGWDEKFDSNFIKEIKR